MSKYNFIHEKLVKEGGDIFGMLAYSIYKKEKIDYIRSLESEGRTNKNGEVSQKDIESFHIHSNSDASIERFKSEAESLLNRAYEELLKSERVALESDAQKLALNLIEKQSNGLKVSKGWKQYFVGVSQSIVGSIGFVFLVGLAYLLLEALKIDLFGFLR